jgi:hypothetical protein
MMGPLHGGTAWVFRQDAKYSNPIDLTEFQRLNAQYIVTKLNSPQRLEHSEHMLQEILSEVELGRIEGPFAMPSSWTHKTVAVPSRPDLPLLPCTQSHPATAMAFPIIQVGSDGKAATHVAKHPEQRAIPMRQMLRDEAMQAFLDWQANASRVQY